MVLPSELISEFVKVTNDTVPTQPSTTMVGTIKVIDGTQYVQLNGSELLTPIVTTTDVIDGDQVTVEIKNHTATVTGNMSSPAARTDDLKEIGGKISEFEIVIADKVSTEQLEAQVARIDTLVSDNVTINKTLTANTANINKLIAKDVEIDGVLSAKQAEIDNLKANKIDASIVEATYATIRDLQATEISVETFFADVATVFELHAEQLEAHDASIENLEVNKLSAKDADLKYANIDFANIGEAAIGKIYANIGVIEGITTKDVSVTGKLVAVNIHGDVIEGNTIKADKLIVLGDDGLYYKLNVNSLGETTASSDAKYKNGLDGSVIIAESITANKIDVTDLVAFGATIGGFKITENSIYSGSKSTVDNTTRGMFLDNTGQVAFGDSNNFLKYYYDNTSQSYKLAVSADTVTFGVGKKNIETALNDIQTDIDNIEVGGRNIITNSKNMQSYTSGSDTGATRYYTTEGDVTFITFDMSTRSDGIDYDNAYVWLTFSIEKKQGEEYTISFDYRSQTDAKLYFYPNQNDQKFTLWSLPSSGGEWMRFSRTYIHTGTTTAETSLFGCHHPTDNTLPIDIRLPKLEKGNKATDWTPAPEDTDADIATAQTTANTAKSDAANAQTTANTAKTDAANAQSTANTAKSDAAKAQSTANTARTEAANAAKTATNYIAGTDSGLIVGNMTAGTLGNNVLIDTDSVDIRNGDTVFASYGANLIELGKNNIKAVIDICDGLARFENRIIANEDYNGLTIYSTNSIGLETAGEILMDVNYESADMLRYMSGHVRLTADNPWIEGDPRVSSYNVSVSQNIRETATSSIVSSMSDLTLDSDGYVTLFTLGNAGLVRIDLNGKSDDELSSIYMQAHRFDFSGNYLDITTNNARIRGVNKYDEIIEAFQVQNSNGNTVIGWGNYNKTELRSTADGDPYNDQGNTNVYGQDVHIGVAKANKVFRPYYRVDDVIESITFRGSGYLTNSKRSVYFTVPLAKPVIGNPPVSVASDKGFMLRQNNAYTHGCASNKYVKPDGYTTDDKKTVQSYAASLDESGCFVRITANFSTTTNAINNAPIGIDWNGIIIFGETVG